MEVTMQKCRIWVARLLAVAVAAVVGAVAFAAPASAFKTCNYQYLCVWSDANYTGYTKSFYYCGTVDLLNEYWPGTNVRMYHAGAFANFEATNVSSVFNNQSRGTVSIFQDDYSASYGNRLYQTAP